MPKLQSSRYCAIFQATWNDEDRTFGTLIGPTAAGFAFDLNHSYTLPILAGIAVMLIAAAIVSVTSRKSATVATR